MNMQRTICIDLDGTIADDSSGFQGVGIFGAPLPGAVDALRQLKAEGWTIIIHTCRLETVDIDAYLNSWGIPFDGINEERHLYNGLPCNPAKPTADVYLDDRAIRFKGNWKKALQQIRTVDKGR